eukprot:Skav207234  [mRNA]  locus=scaffold523:48754:55296:+ [translate_table: standard]
MVGISTDLLCLSAEDSGGCWLLGNQAVLHPQPNATSGPRRCGDVPSATPSATPSVAPGTVETASTVAEATEEMEEVVKKVGDLAAASRPTGMVLWGTSSYGGGDAESEDVKPGNEMDCSALQHRAQYACMKVVAQKTKDGKVIEDANKVIAATGVGTLPDEESVHLGRQAMATGERYGHGTLEAAEEGVSYGVGTPWTDATVPFCFSSSDLASGAVAGTIGGTWQDHGTPWDATKPWDLKRPAAAQHGPRPAAERAPGHGQDPRVGSGDPLRADQQQWRQLRGRTWDVQGMGVPCFKRGPADGWT